MHATITTNQVKEWADKAHSTLQRAEKLCTNAEDSLNSTAFQLTTHLPDIIDEAATLFDALKRQHELIMKIVEPLTSLACRSLIEIPQMQFNTLLNPALSNLEAIVQQLHHTSIPSFLISEAPMDGPERPLDDFISTDSITLLKVNIEIYRNNWLKIRKVAETQLKEQITDVMHNNLSKKYAKIVKLYDEIKPLQIDVKNSTTGKSPLESNTLIATILKENMSLEHELVKLLKMLTNHYDQCTKAVEFVSNNSTLPNNLEILKNDTLELPDVLRDLNSVCDMIVNNETRAQRFLDANSPKIELIISSTRDQLDQYREFKSKNLPQFSLLVNKFEEIISKSSLPEDLDSNQSPIERYAETLNELTYHYTQCLYVIRTQYLEELHREQFKYPKLFLSSLTEFLNENMYKLQVQEKIRRKEWLAKYGSFIPKEFKIPGEKNQPAIVQVITEGLEDVQRDATEIELEERMLVDYINKLKSQNPSRRKRST
ncbi:autophagy-related protein 17 [Scheffersomyces coipomensis]|uniref:autophagy-related protein 17 n=1 Tax=Scheffersomyces coipomensis TaxID=1788519 RepID=UPI00315C777D